MTYYMPQSEMGLFAAWVDPGGYTYFPLEATFGENIFVGFGLVFEATTSPTTMVATIPDPLYIAGHGFDSGDIVAAQDGRRYVIVLTPFVRTGSANSYILVKPLPGPAPIGVSSELLLFKKNCTPTFKNYFGP